MQIIREMETSGEEGTIVSILCDCRERYRDTSLTMAGWTRTGSTCEARPKFRTNSSSTDTEIGIGTIEQVRRLRLLP